MSHVFKPSCLPLKQWPLLHREAWNAALASKDILDTDFVSVDWRPASITRNTKAYGIWLSWHVANGKDISDSRPEDLVTKDALRAFVADLQAVNASFTVSDRVQALYSVMRILAPQSKGYDWEWLCKVMGRLRTMATPSRDKLSRLKSAGDIYALGRSLIAEADAAEHTSDMTLIERAMSYRDGLMIALLIHRPLRRANFASLAFGTTFVMLDGTAVLAIDPGHSKTNRRIESELPEDLYAHLCHYLEVYRPILMGHSVKAQRNTGPKPLDALWVSRDGTQLAEESIRGAIERRTRHAFGKPIPSHWFRDAAVTSLIQDAPESARLASGVLGYSDVRITEKHYNQAQTIHSARRHANVISSYIQSDGAA
jgi:integrase/recombinase XerD